MPTDAEIAALYKRADEAFQKHNYDYARDLFLQILLFNADHDQSRKALKVTIIRKFQEQGASSKIRMLAIKGQFEVQLKATKDLQKRIDLCQKFLNDDPTNSKVRGILADALLSLNHYKGAAAEAEMALSDDPHNISAAKTLVGAYKNTGNVKDAQAWLERIASQVKEDRDLEKLQRDLAAMQTMKAGFEDAATAGYRKVLKNADEAEDLAKRTKLIQSDADFNKMLDEFQADMAENPTDARVPKRIGDLYFDKKKDYTAARDWYRKASQLAPQDSVLRDKVDDCDLRLWQVKVDAAQKANDPKLNEIKLASLKAHIASYERRVSDRPTDMTLRFELGKAYYVGTMIDKAIGEFQQSMRDPKRKADSHFYLARCFQKKKMFDMAEKQYVMAEDGVLSQDKKCEILYYRAKCYEEAGKMPQAIDLGNKIIEIDISYKDISALVEKWSAAAPK